MKKLCRDALIMLLVFGLTVDQAAAWRLFQRGCCPTTCIEVCPPACPVPVCADPCGVDAEYAAGTENCCENNEPPAAEPTSSEEIPPLEEAPVAPTPEPARSSAPDHTEVPSKYEPTFVPPSIGTPEQADDSTATTPEPVAEETTPTTAESAQTRMVGDRYSSSDAIFGPQESTDPDTSEAEENEALESDDVEDVFDAPAIEDSDDPFGESVSAAEESQPTPTAAFPGKAVLPAKAAPRAAIQERLPMIKSENLFGPANKKGIAAESSTETVPQPSVPTEEKTEAKTDKEEEEDPFDPFGDDLTDLGTEGAILSVAGGLHSDELRTWSDDSQTYQCRARLVKVTAKGVVLQQATGTNLHVPLQRLADADLQFVHGQVTALRIVRARDAAAEKLALVWTR